METDHTAQPTDDSTNAAAQTDSQNTDTPSPTHIQLLLKDGQVIEGDLTHLDLNDAQALYETLGQVQSNSNTDYQAVADAVANVAKNTNAIISLPKGTDVPKLVGDFMKAMKASGGVIDDKSRAMFDQLGPLAKDILDSKSYESLAGQAATLGTVNEVLRGMGRPLDAIGKTWDAGGAVIGEAGLLKPGISEAQAKAIGAAYAAALYMQVDAPAAPAKHEVNVIDKGVAWGQHLFDGVWHWLAVNFPIVNIMLGATVKWFENGCKDWNGAKAAATQEVADFAAKPVKTYDERLQENLQHQAAAQRPKAADILEDAQDVAGVKTKDYVDMIRNNGAVIRGTDGTYYTTSFDDKGLLSQEALNGPDGQPLTFSHRMGGKIKAPLDALTPDNSAQALGESLVIGGGSYVLWKNRKAIGAAAVAAKDTVVKTAHGTLRAGTAFVSQGAKGFAEGNAESLPFNSGRAAENAANKALDKAVRERDAFKTAIEAKKARIAELEEKLGTKTEEQAAKKTFGEAIRDGVDKTVQDTKNLAKKVTSKEGREALKAGAQRAKEQEELGKLQKSLEKDGKKLAKLEEKVAAKEADVASAAAKAVKPKGFWGKALDKWFGEDSFLGRRFVGKGFRATGTGLEKLGKLADTSGDLLVNKGSVKLLGALTKTELKEVQLSATIAGSAGKLGGKALGKFIPFVGWFIGAGELTLGHSDDGDKNRDGTTMNYVQQLWHDYHQGKISAAELTEYQSLQAAYFGTSGLSWIGMGAQQAALTGLEHFDADKARRYLPESVLGAIGDMVTLKGLHSAAADTHMRMRAAQESVDADQGAMQGMRKVNGSDTAGVGNAQQGQPSYSAQAVASLRLVQGI